jgi:hypothetical protein
MLVRRLYCFDDHRFAKVRVAWRCPLQVSVRIKALCKVVFSLPRSTTRSQNGFATFSEPIPDSAV